jgi:Flp pilus assembly pilin Flp
MKLFCVKFCQDESAQDLIEYVLLLAFVALSSASMFLGAGNNINAIWQTGSNNLPNAATSAS